MGSKLLLGVGKNASVLASVPWVAQWKFNNDGNDSIGANHLTNNNSATFTEGKLGGATGATQLVAASSQYWSIADNTVLSMGDVDFSIALWLYLDSVGVERNCVAKFTSMGNQREYKVIVQSNNVLRFIVSPDGTSGFTTVNASNFGALSAATWYCVIAYHNAVNNVIGIAVNDTTPNTAAHTTGTFNGTSDFKISGEGTSGVYWNGRIDNVCIAKSAAGAGGVLTAAQRTAFYASDVGTEAITQAVAYQRAKRRIWRDITREWEKFKRDWFAQGRGAKSYAFYPLRSSVVPSPAALIVSI